MTTNPSRPDRMPDLCKFRLVCTKSWEALTIGEQQEVRHCEECKKNVFKVHNRRERNVAAALNRCVAIVAHGGFVYMMGNPERNDEWAALSKARLVVQLAKELTEDRQLHLARDFPVLFEDPHKTMDLLRGAQVVLGEFQRELVDDLMAELATMAPELHVTTDRARWHFAGNDQAQPD